MTKVDPMHYLINTILDEKEIVIFLGGGASMEGRQKEKRFPGSDELMEAVIKKFGENVPSQKKKREDLFFEIIKKWDNEKKLSTRLRKFLDGEPGLAHYCLAALSLALYGDSNALLYLTKNHDDLMNKAFTDILRKKDEGIDIIVISLNPDLTGSNFKKIFCNIEGHIKDGRPVLLKLFGDLNSTNPIFKDDDIEFQPEVERKLSEWMAKPMIVIGYSFSDKKIRGLLSASEGNSPIFLINPLKKIPHSIKSLDRIQHIKCSFRDCLNKLLEIIQKRNPSINRKVDKILELLDPTTLLPDFNSIQNRVKLCSKASILRTEERIPKIEVNGKIRKLIPIPRKDTSPDFERFLQSDRQLLAVIGDSGSGKSTLLYRIAKNESNKRFITLFYDVHHLQSAGSLTKKLAEDFRCEQRQLETIFKHFDKILSKEKKKLLIIIDGLNESISIDPSDFKIDIENLGAKLPGSIKIAYSCRTIYWNSYIKVNAPISSLLYHDSKEFLLHFYSESEAQLAFDVYKDLFKFRGVFNSLKDEFKEKIRDPLMLRMLAEGYQGEKLPTFAPAVKIFRNYEKVLKIKFKGNAPLIDFIYELIAFKLEEINTHRQVSDQFVARKIRTNSNFLNLFQLAKPKDPFVLLEDEGILSLLDEEETTYRFTYDRFFEYLLGKEIGKRIKLNSKEDFVTNLSEKILSFQRVHFSFLQALKSEIIRKNIKNPSGIWSFYEPYTLKLLLNNQNVAIVNFAKEVLRELTFEGEKDTLEALKEIKEDELEWKLIALDIACDSSRVKPFLIEGLFSGSKLFTRRCVNALSVLIENQNIREEFEKMIFSDVQLIKKFERKHAMGIFYYLALIFSIEDKLGRDPFIEIKSFIKKCFSLLGDQKSDAIEVLKIEFARLAREEGPLMFGSKFNIDRKEFYGIDYLWRFMGEEERKAALKMNSLFLSPEKLRSEESIELIKFFGSEIEHWNKRKNPECCSNFTYDFEYRIAQWILISHSQSNFDDVLTVLENLVLSDYWLCIDFALCIMRSILEFMYPSDKKIINQGFDSMKRWTNKFENNKQLFYSTLNIKNPFSLNFIPLEPVARIALLHFSPDEGPVPILEDYLSDSELNKKLLALLCTRYFWRRYPLRILGTLELVLNDNNSKVIEWLDRILKEIYLVYPRNVENFFWKNNVSQDRIYAIKYRKDVIDPTGVVYDGYPFYKALFLQSQERRAKFVEWYAKIFDTESFDEYFNKLVDYLYEEIERE